MSSYLQASRVIRYVQALEPKAEAVALPLQNLPAVAGSVEENEKYRVERCHFYIQLDQCGEAVDGFSEVHGLGLEIDFFDFGVGSHHQVLAPERNQEHSIGDQLSALNVGFMERLRLKHAWHSLGRGMKSAAAPD
ncbi:hypothetical protein MRY17_18385 [Pseudomonas orientalis]|uniref:hypothetical protein n=1 Tax=Pseudomonas orientalis TaxID=76758 RepID=UPI001FAEA60C|nr:hypothetical protein [Pseudomonas orientalis]UOB22683.1 hypothetical protein MRY17_18385 [Pseudomonas orientalis]